MARQDVHDLYQQLHKSHFSFVPRGEHTVHDVYAMVKTQHPTLCDDNFLCANNCSRGSSQPEWQHVVRRSLQSHKVVGAHVARSGRTRHWVFK